VCGLANAIRITKRQGVTVGKNFKIQRWDDVELGGISEKVSAVNSNHFAVTKILGRILGSSQNATRAPAAQKTIKEK
jgi:hypothetical protein